MTSPYVSVYISRRQAEALVAAAKIGADGRAPSSPVWAALRNVEAVLACRCDARVPGSWIGCSRHDPSESVAANGSESVRASDDRSARA